MHPPLLTAHWKDQVKRPSELVDFDSSQGKKNPYHDVHLRNFRTEIEIENLLLVLSVNEELKWKFDLKDVEEEEKEEK